MKEENKETQLKPWGGLGPKTAGGAWHEASQQWKQKGMWSGCQVSTIVSIGSARAQDMCGFPWNEELSYVLPLTPQQGDSVWRNS